MARPLTLESTMIVRTSAELAKWFREEADRRGCRPADLHRMALAQFMGRTMKQSKPSGPCCAVVTKEAVR